MRPPTKLQVIANFWSKKTLQPFITHPPHTLQIYLRQTIFCSPTSYAVDTDRYFARVKWTERDDSLQSSVEVNNRWR